MGALGQRGAVIREMVRMVDVGDKAVTRREAVAEGFLRLRPATAQAVASGSTKKGDVVAASKLAGIHAAKSTADLLPLCHQVPLTSIDVDIEVRADGLRAVCSVTANYKTGVEMEALVGVTAALLNAWDMVKYLEKDAKGQYPQTAIEGVRVVRKSKRAR